jgi:Ca-activated chloride channel family protein
MKRVRLAALAFLMLASCEVNPAERNNAGNSLYEQERYVDAVNAYQAAQVVAPDAPESYYNAASALANTGRLGSAVEALEQALKTADEELTTKAYYNLGNVYFDMAQYDKAIESYRKVLLRRPDDEDARYNYELALSRLPTPTPDEQSPDAQPSPTRNAGGQEDSTPTPDVVQTPTPQGDEGQNRESFAPTPMPAGTLSVEDAERLLDAIQQNQRTLREYLERFASPVQSSEKDW